MLTDILFRCCPWLSCSKKKKEPKSFIKAKLSLISPNAVWYSFLIKFLDNHDLTNQNLGWNALQRIHGLIAQVCISCSN